MSTHTFSGSFGLIRHAWAKSHWVNGVPKYGENWMIKFYLPGERSIVKMGPDKVRFRLCGACLALPHGVMPAAVRSDCSCQVAPRRWAKAVVAARSAMAERAELDKWEEMLRPVKWTPLNVALAQYESMGPVDARKRVQYLRTIIEVATGKTAARMDWEDLSKAVCFEFAELWQEAGRRGWLARGALPPTGWRQLRVQRARAPWAVDRRTVMACNTSIKGYLASAKSIFNQLSRDNILRGLLIPPLTAFLETRVGVKIPRGHRAFSREDYLAMMNALPALKDARPEVWLVNQLMLRFGLRPEEVWPIQQTWLEEMTVDGVTRTRLNLVNREEEGFELKAGPEAAIRRVWMPEEMLVVIRQVANEVSILGTKNKAQAQVLVERTHPQWLRSLGITVPRPNYHLRHFAGAERLTSSGATAAGALLGHASGSAVTERVYARNLATLEPLSDAEVYRRLMEEG